MIIAVTYNTADGTIFQHFGHSENIKFYVVENNEVTSSVIMNTNGNGHGALAGFLKSNGADIVICGGIGGGAKNALSQCGIKLFGGVSGDADTAVNNYLSGNLDYDPDVMCSHHGEGHTCHH